jgi:hypothetical protein
MTNREPALRWLRLSAGWGALVMRLARKCEKELKIHPECVK